MKRLLFIVIALSALMACEGPEGPQGPMGPSGTHGQNGKDGKDGRDGDGSNWYYKSITVHESDWKIKGNPGDLNSYFTAFKPLDALDEYVFKYGTVIAYLEIEPGIKNGMPYVLHLGEESGGKEFLWTQTYDFDFEVGGVGFYVTYSDFNTQIRPGAETFHIVLMW